MSLGVRFHVIVFMLVISIITPSLVFAQEAAPAPSVPAPTEPVKPPRIPVTTTVGVQLSGTDVQYANNLYANLSVQQSRGPDNWYMRGYYYGTYSPDYNGYSTRIDYRKEDINSDGSYSVWTGILSKYQYFYHYGGAPTTSPGAYGYNYISYGPGKQFDARNKGEIGFGYLTTYGSPGSNKPALCTSFTGSRPLGKNLTFDSRILILQPMEHLKGTRADSDIGLSYAFTPGLSIRYGWTTNNFVWNLYENKEWTSNTTLSISFNKTFTR